MKQNENEMNFSVPLEIIKASEIEPKEVKWLWYPYISFGKVTLLQGDPGDGKSKLMLSIAALLSKGEPLPFTETEENEPMRRAKVQYDYYPRGVSFCEKYSRHASIHTTAERIWRELSQKSTNRNSVNSGQTRFVKPQ